MQPKILELDSIRIKRNDGLKDDEIIIHANLSTIKKIKGIRLTIPEHYSK